MAGGGVKRVQTEFKFVSLLLALSVFVHRLLYALLNVVNKPLLSGIAMDDGIVQ